MIRFSEYTSALDEAKASVTLVDLALNALKLDSYVSPLICLSIDLKHSGTTFDSRFWYMRTCIAVLTELSALPALWLNVDLLNLPAPARSDPLLIPYLYENYFE